MPLHAEFHAFLGELPDGENLQSAYQSYKTAENEGAYTVNGYLKGNVPIPEVLHTLLNHLRRCICGRNTAAMTLWRMTSDREFTGTLLPREIGEPFTYLAFMSASGRPEAVHTFVPDDGLPLLLEIRCPANTPMAPMEAGDEEGLENEFLLGCGTKFNVIEAGELTDGELRDNVGLFAPAQKAFRMVIEVAQNPGYTNDFKFYDFPPPELPVPDTLN